MDRTRNKSADTGGFELVYKQPIGRRHLFSQETSHEIEKDSLSLSAKISMVFAKDYLSDDTKVFLNKGKEPMHRISKRKSSNI